MKKFNLLLVVIGLFSINVMTPKYGYSQDINASITHETCPNTADGTITLTYTDGSACENYNYEWMFNNNQYTPNQSDCDLQNLAPGYYSVTITNEEGCTAEETFFIEEVPEITALETIVSTCEGNEGGSISINVGGGNGNYTYSWYQLELDGSQTSVNSNDNQEGLSSINGIDANDNYFVEVTDEEECTEVFGAFSTIVEPIEMNYVKDVKINVTSSNGTIQLYNGTWTKYDNCVLFSETQQDISPSQLAGSSATVYVQTNNPVYSLTLDFIQGLTGMPSNNFTTWTFTTPTNIFDNQLQTQGYVDIQLVFGIADPNETSLLDIVTVSNNMYECVEIPTRQPDCSWLPSEPQGKDLVHRLTVGSCLFIEPNFVIDHINGNLGITNFNLNNYSIIWNGETIEDVNTTHLSNVSPGLYSVVITDLNNENCFVEYFLNLYSKFDVIFEYSYDCSGQVIELCAVPSGGSGAYSYKWDTEVLEACTGGINVGETHCVKILDIITGIEDIFCTTIPPFSPTISASFETTPPCPIDEPTGTICATVSGGVAPYIYEWSNGILTDEDCINVPSGIYNVTITDNCGVEYEFNELSVGNDNSELILTEVYRNEPDLTCPNGILIVQVSEGIAPYQYTWTNGETISGSNNSMLWLTEIPFGTNSITVTDACGAEASYTFYLAPQTISDWFSYEADITPACIGISTDNGQANSNNGYIDLTVNAIDNSSFSYEWSTGQISEDIEVSFTSPQTLHSVTVTNMDIENCYYEIDIDIPIYEVSYDDWNIYQKIDPFCNNTVLGEATIYVNGDGEGPLGNTTSNYVFDWSYFQNGNLEMLSGAGLNSITTDEPINFNYQITDPETNCSITATNQEIPSVVQITNVQTFAYSNNGEVEQFGQALITVIGGVPPYIYTLNGVYSQMSFEENTLIQELTAEDYTLVVKDANDCIASIKFSIDECNETPELTILDFQAQRDNPGTTDDHLGFMTVKAIGGTPPYSFQWSAPEDATVNISQNGYLFTLNSLTVDGEYCVTVTDNCGAWAEVCQVIKERIWNVEYKTNECGNTAWLKVKKITNVPLNYDDVHFTATFAWSSGEVEKEFITDMDCGGLGNSCQNCVNEEGIDCNMIPLNGEIETGNIDVSSNLEVLFVEIKDEFGGIQYFTVQLGNCSFFNGLIGDLEDLTFLSNIPEYMEKVYYGADRHKNCGINGVPFPVVDIKPYWFFPADEDNYDPSNPCAMGTIKAKSFLCSDDSSIECNLSYPPAIIQTNDDIAPFSAIYIPEELMNLDYPYFSGSDDTGNNEFDCGCLYPPGSTIPPLDIPILAYFNCSPDGNPDCINNDAEPPSEPVFEDENCEDEPSLPSGVNFEECFYIFTCPATGEESYVDGPWESCILTTSVILDDNSSNQVCYEYDYCTIAPSNFIENSIIDCSNPNGLPSCQTVLGLQHIPQNVTESRRGSILPDNEDNLSENYKENHPFKVVNVFPNPTNSGFRVELDVFQSTLLSINIYDILGQPHYQDIFDFSIEKRILDFTQFAKKLPKGVYYIEIRDNEGNKEVKKILIQ